MATSQLHDCKESFESCTYSNSHLGLFFPTAFIEVSQEHWGQKGTGLAAISQRKIWIKNINIPPVVPRPNPNVHSCFVWEEESSVCLLVCPSMSFILSLFLYTVCLYLMCLICIIIIYNIWLCYMCVYVPSRTPAICHLPPLCHPSSEVCFHTTHRPKPSCS